MAAAVATTTPSAPCWLWDAKRLAAASQQHSSTAARFEWWWCHLMLHEGCQRLQRRSCLFGGGGTSWRRVELPARGVLLRVCVPVCIRSCGCSTVLLLGS